MTKDEISLLHGHFMLIEELLVLILKANLYLKNPIIMDSVVNGIQKDFTDNFSHNNRIVGDLFNRIISKED